MSSNFQTFRELHTSGDLFVIPNVWDAKSARVFQGQRFPAIATSSYAVAETLGYEDGEGMSFTDYLFVIRRILATSYLPLSVDLEMGYGSSDEAIYDNIRQLINLGVVGINIEDSVIVSGNRRLKDAGQFAKTIGYIRRRLSAEGLDLFINVRCDTFILDVADKLAESLRRLPLYESAGADGIFLPCILDEDDIRTVIQQTKLPLNVMYLPGLPDLARLHELGVKRVSMGAFVFSKLYDNISSILPK